MMQLPLLLRKALIMCAGLFLLAQAAPTSAQGVATGAPQPKGDVVQLDSKSIALGGQLRAPELWQSYKARFVTDQGRVVDTGNKMMSHSEGQGYGMLLAVAANDRIAFERIWGWTRANLMVRDDELPAWRWEPDQRPGVGDTNDASDGDILIAWALTEAAEFWADTPYRVAARRIAVEIGRRTMLFKTTFGTILLPGSSGFTAKERADGPVINLSYWVYPAFSRLNIIAPDIDWAGLSTSGIDLLARARFGSQNLPSEWTALKNDTPKPAEGFPKTFGYNALRIPLYLAFAGVGDLSTYAPFTALWQNGQGMAVIDLVGGGATEQLPEPGYRAVAALARCATNNVKFPAELRRGNTNENYYPATLRLLALIAAQMRYPSCLQG